MPAKSYREKASLLRSVGYKITYGTKAGGKRDLSRKKSAITRAWKRAGAFLESGTHKFIPATRKQRSDFASSKARSPGGFFQPVPAGVSPSKIRYKLKGGVLRQSVSDPKTGQRRNDFIVKVDSRKMAALGQEYINDLIAQYKLQGLSSKLTFRLMVNGWDGKNPYNIKDIGNYLTDSFFPKLRWQKLKAREVNDIFHLKIIAFDDRPGPRPPGTDLDDRQDDENEEEDPF